MTQKKSGTFRVLTMVCILIFIIFAVFLANRIINRTPLSSDLLFQENQKEGGSAFFILGDYFNEAFAKELAAILLGFSPECNNYFICTENIKKGLQSWMSKEGMQNINFLTTEISSHMMKTWARDIVICGANNQGLAVVVSPTITSDPISRANQNMAMLKQLFPAGTKIVRAPFVFEGGNLVFLMSRGKKVLLVGKKILFDNAEYQRRYQASNRTTIELLDEIQRFFSADSIIVVGKTSILPPSEAYFESQLEMGMAVLRGSKAVVAQFSYGEKEKAELKKAVFNHDFAIESLYPADRDRNEVFGILDERLKKTKEEFDYYAILLEDLGLHVFRSPMQWKHVASWMSWTAVLQVGTRIFMPIYPESLSTATEMLEQTGSALRKSLKLKPLSSEKFELTGYNLQNYDLYKGFGYEIVPVPEYLHYFQGNIHSFVNIMD